MSYHPTDQSDEQHHTSQWDSAVSALTRAGYDVDARTGLVQRSEFDLDPDGDPGAKSLAEHARVAAIVAPYGLDVDMLDDERLELRRSGGE